MKTFRIRFNMSTYQASALACERAGFGWRNEGVTILAQTPEQAVEQYNRERLPGDQLNAFYLKVTEEGEAPKLRTFRIRVAYPATLSKLVEVRAEDAGDVPALALKHCREGASVAGFELDEGNVVDTQAFYFPDGEVEEVKA